MNTVTKTLSEETVHAVTGRLARIDFNMRKITILYPVDNRKLECSYDESAEEMLVKNRRGLIQVIGEVILDEEGEPQKIIEVQDIRELDLSPFYLKEFHFEERTIRFRSPLKLQPELDESQQLICLEYLELGIDVYAFTREELVELLESEIEFLWRMYALADDERLTLKAAELKHNLLNTLEEVVLAKK